MSALPILVVTKEGETLRSQSLEKDISIGRADGNVIRLEDRAVSRKHAVVRKTPEGIQIEKQSDFAPIRLNGVECTRALLKDGDVVEIGPFRMRLESQKAEASKKEALREFASELPKEVPAAVEDVEAFSAAPLAAAAPRFVESPTLAPVEFEPTSSIELDATLALPDSEPDPLPTETIDLTAGGSPLADFTGALSIDGASPDLAQPIVGDTLGAEDGSKDPGTNIFDHGGSDLDSDGEVPPLDIDFGAPLDSAVGDEIEEISSQPFDEDAATRVLKSTVDARLEIPEGQANFQSFDLKKPEIVIGRGKECDIVLNDKKSSRKNTKIVREGNRYLVRDLDSSNGTYLNGNSVKEAELSDGDMLRVGDAEIRFVGLNKDYERRKNHFVPVEEAIASAGIAPLEGQVPSTPIAYIGSIGAPTAFGAGEATTSTAAPAVQTRKGIWGAYDKYFRNFSTLKPLQKMLVVLSVGLFLSWYFEDELGLVEKPVSAPSATAPKKATEGGAVIAAEYDTLSPEKKSLIDDAIRKATDFLRLQDFDKAIYEVQTQIYPILPNYSQAKEIERYAQEGKRRKDAIEEEAKRKEEERKLKERIADLEKQTRDFMAKKDYENAKEVFSEILAVDPDNASVSEWKREIETWLEQQALAEQERLVQEEINKRAWDTYNEAFEIHKAGRFREAIEIYRKVAEIGASEGTLLKKATTMIKACQDSIRELREPHLTAAKESERAGELGAAFKSFQKATEVDPSHPEGWAGMERIRDVLTERAKILYTEAVIAESYSDFKVAHTKFNEIMKMAPEGSLYFQRAQRKLQSYLNFKPEE